MLKKLTDDTNITGEVIATAAKSLTGVKLKINEMCINFVLKYGSMKREQIVRREMRTPLCNGKSKQLHTSLRGSSYKEL